MQPLSLHQRKFFYKDTEGSTPHAHYWSTSVYSDGFRGIFIVLAVTGFPMVICVLGVPHSKFLHTNRDVEGSRFDEVLSTN